MAPVRGLTQTGVEVHLDADEHSVFATIRLVRRALLLAGTPSHIAGDYTDAALQCHSYDELLRVTKETVTVR